MQSFQVMLERFLIWILESPGDAKAVVHCSAGIGRTGTTVTLAHAIINTHAQVNNGQKPVCSIFSIVRRLREQRFGLVQMPNQFMFIFVFFMQYLQS